MLAPMSGLLRTLRSQLAPGNSSKSILPFLPRPLKYLILLILLVNIRGLPLFWTVRVFRPAIYSRVYHGFRSLFETPAQRRARLTSLAPVGKNPFDTEIVFTTRATPDASDFNLHLSNSSYAMSFDMARFKYFVQHMALLYVDGGWIALGASHYSFIREIPLNTKYEIRLSFASWDHKWMYIVARYVTYPSKDAKSKTSQENTAHQPKNNYSTLVVLPPTVTPQNSATPSPSRSPPPSIVTIGRPLPPGAILHCTAIASLCCKIGRITIPPAVAMAASGFGVSPARWEEISDWRAKNRGARLRQLYAGGWKEFADGERWWEDAFAGDIERQRVQGLNGLAASVGLPVPGQNV